MDHLSEDDGIRQFSTKDGCGCAVDELPRTGVLKVSEFGSSRAGRVRLPHGFAKMLFSGIFVVATSGCGQEESGLPLIPVTGVVSLDGKPLTTGGSVSFRDQSGLVQATGKIESDGIYKLHYDGKEGAPEGFYKVVVFATEPLKGRGHGGLPRLIVDKKFTIPGRTPLKAEVKADASPGDYDFTVTK